MRKLAAANTNLFVEGILRRGVVDSNHVEVYGFPVIINHQINFGERVRRTGCAVIDPRIEVSKFPQAKCLRGTETVLLRLVRICYASLTSEVQSLIESENLIPARVEHLIAFGEIFPEYQRHCAVVALGNAFYSNSRSAVVPILHTALLNGKSVRSIELLPAACIWDSSCEFLAVAPQ